MTNKEFVLKLHLILELIMAISTLMMLVFQDRIYYWYYPVSYISLIFMLFQILGYIIYEISIFDFNFIFIILTYFFMFSHPFLLAFGFEEYIFWELYKEFSNELMLKAGLLVLNYVELFYIGTLIKKRRFSSRLYRNFIQKDGTRQSKIIYKTGGILFLLSFPFRLYTDYTLIRDSKMTSIIQFK